MRRRLQLSLCCWVVAGVPGCKTDKPVRAPGCEAPGDLDEKLLERARSQLTLGPGRFQIDNEGCLFLSGSTDGGVSREATEARQAGVWRVSDERLEGPGQTVEREDPDLDGVWDTMTVTRFGDAGWASTEHLELETDGGFLRRYRRTPIDALRMRVVQEVRTAGGWETEEDFETSTLQR